MRRRVGRSNVFVVVCLAVIGWLHPSAAFSIDTGFTDARQLFLAGIKKQNPSERAAAVAKFSMSVRTETVELILKRGLSDGDPTVRLAVRTALKTLAADPAVCRFMIDELKKSSKLNAIESNSELWRALLVTEDLERQCEILQFIDDTISSPKGGLLAPMTLIDQYGQQGDADAVRSVATLAKAKPFETHFGYRRCVVQAMSQLRHQEAVDFLINLLQDADGLIKDDIVRYLTRLTKQKFGEDNQRWANWWRQNRNEFQIPEADKELPNDEEEYKGSLSYYGIPVRAKRIVFIVDCDKRLFGARFAIVQNNLINTITALPETTSFDVVLFDSLSVHTWHPELVAATTEAKKAATQRIMHRLVEHPLLFIDDPATVAAMARALRLQPEAIYIISDRTPQIPLNDQLNWMSQANRVYRVSVYAIGILRENKIGPKIIGFLDTLAENNYGSYTTFQMRDLRILP